jgi:predicted site-specific integrase-resolvase
MAKVTIKEAADRLGIVEATVRRRIHRGELQAVQESTPQGFVWMVEVPDGVDKVQAESTGEVEALRELAARDRRLEVKDR